MRLMIPILFVIAATAAAADVRAADEAKMPDPGAPDFARQVMRYQDDLFRGESSQGKMRMKVKTSHWTRSMLLESWSKGKEHSLVRILEPKKEKGTATLKAQDDLYIYLSKTGRTVKITAGMMGGSWMGSHFTNDDLIRHTRLSEDYALSYETKTDGAGAKLYLFTAIPKPEAPVVWGKLTIEVRAADLQPVAQVYYDEDGRPVRRLEFSDHKRVDGRTMPTRLVMRPLDGSGEYTEMNWEQVTFGVKLDGSFFSIRKLRAK